MCPAHRLSLCRCRDSGQEAITNASADQRAGVFALAFTRQRARWHAVVELWNRGQDMHDTRIRRLNAAGQMVGPVLGRVKVTMPGRISQATWHLKAGRYELYCSMPGHMALGMHAKLTVTRA